MGYAEILIPFAGGLGMFIYGMQIMAQGLENAAGNKVKSFLEVLTKNKFFGVLLGMLITAVIQSSSATTVMVVGFVNAGIMNLGQAMGVIMGANIGTTVTGWLVSSVEWAKALSPANLAPIEIMVGVVIMLAGKRHSSKDVSSIIVGFGILFVGISTMSAAVAPLKDSPEIVNLFITLGKNPLLGILAGTVVTAIIQSSSASVGILQSLAASGLVPMSAAIYIILGQNIGTCVTAILSSVGTKKNAKTAALMHLLFNMIGTVMFGVVAVLFFTMVRPSMANGTITQTQISAVHTIFNIGTTILLFPASNLIIKLAEKIGRVGTVEQEEGILLLDDRMLETPGIALQSTFSETLRMGHVVMDSLEKASSVLFTQSREDIQVLKTQEDLVDKLSAGISEYAIKISSLQVSDREHQEVAHLLQIISDMERVSDYCENISEYAETLYEKKAAFSELGTEGIRQMFAVCTDSFQYALKAFEEGSREKALKAIEKETQADDLEISLRTKHIERLTNNQCDTEAGIVFLDAITSLERISDHARNIAEEVLKKP